MELMIFNKDNNYIYSYIYMNLHYILITSSVIFTMLYLFYLVRHIYRCISKIELNLSQRINVVENVSMDNSSNHEDKINILNYIFKSEIEDIILKQDDIILKQDDIILKQDDMSKLLMDSIKMLKEEMNELNKKLYEESIRNDNMNYILTQRTKNVIKMICDIEYKMNSKNINNEDNTSSNSISPILLEQNLRNSISQGSILQGSISQLETSNRTDKTTGLKLEELRKIARQLKVKNSGKMNKTELIDKIMELENIDKQQLEEKYKIENSLF